MDISSRKLTKRYSNGEVTVVWQPHLCAHSTICFRGLPEVFDPRERPWVRIGGAPTARIVEQVKQCPSGALSYVMDAPAAAPEAAPAPAPQVRIEVRPAGPLVVHGPVLIERPDGTRDERTKVSLCRCGGSANKPYCDGSHRTNGFQG
jgi:uncharacterized Fe-S cluster protein YjdI/CDGSH-type Zn-finger protein